MIDDFEGADKFDAATFDFHDVPLFSEAKIGTKKGSDDKIGPVDFSVSVTLSTVDRNEDDDYPQCPYDFDIEAQIWISVSQEIPRGERLTLVETNGTSLAIGAIRELIMNLSSRSGFGPLTIPTLKVTTKLEQPS